MIRDQLAGFSTALTYTSVPASVVAEVKRLLIDHVSSMLAGPQVFATELPDLRRLVRDQGGRPESTMVGVAGQFPCNGAVFANTAMGFTGCDAWHKPSTLHVPAVLFSAAIAVAESVQANGRQLVEAIIAGAEVMIRVSEALGSRNIYARGFHPTSVCGPIGCAVAAGRLLGLTESQMAEAISTAAVHGAGSSIWRGARTPATFCVQIGRAAESGVLAAQLAGDGCYGVDRIFEDPRGFPASYAGEAELNAFTDELGTTFRIARLMMHRFWFGPYLLTSVESLIDLMSEHELEPSDIDSIEARIPHGVVPLIGAVEYPQNRLATLTTLRYALSVVAHMGESALYTPDVSNSAHMTDPSVQSLFERVTVTGDDELDLGFPGVEASILTLRTGDRREFSRRHNGPVRGDPDNPLSDAEVLAKFDVMATPALPKGCGGDIITTIKGIDSLEDVRQLCSLWAVEGETEG